LTPGVGAAGVDDLVLCQGDGVEEELAHEGEIGSVTWRETVLRDGREKFAKNVIDVDSGEEFTGGGFGNGSADGFGFEELTLRTSMEQAEGRVFVVAQHAALAAVGEMELAEMRIIGSGAFFGHGSSLRGVMEQRGKEA